jgi:hypothetical protein
VEHTEVSGKVTFQGKALPGGKVTFVAVNGGFASMGDIDENGHYQISAPLGEVEIGVTNAMMRSKSGPLAAQRLTKAEATKEDPMKGRWVKLPARYADPRTSGLKYTVEPGTQNHDIELAADSAPASGGPQP